MPASDPDSRAAPGGLADAQHHPQHAALAHALSPAPSNCCCCDLACLLLLGLGPCMPAVAGLGRASCCGGGDMAACLCCSKVRASLLPVAVLLGSELAGCCTERATVVQHRLRPAAARVPPRCCADKPSARLQGMLSATAGRLVTHCWPPGDAAACEDSCCCFGFAAPESTPTAAAPSKKRPAAWCLQN